jgi:hypothetical protein
MFKFIFWRMFNFILKKSLKSIISPICFQLNCMENGNKDSSSEAHLDRLKTSSGYYLYLFIFGKIFEFYLVTQYI